MKHYYSLLSGGFDSTLAILKVIYENREIRITPVFFDYGQKSRNEETKAVKEIIPAIRAYADKIASETLIDDCRVIPLGNLFAWSQSTILEGRPDNVDYGLENRNMVFLSCLASLILADKEDSESKEYIEVITGFTNGYYDTHIDFVHDLNTLFENMAQNKMTKRLKVIAPLIPDDNRDNVSEKRSLSIASSLGVIPLLREKTWSCYFPRNGATCKECPPCKKRRRIFTEYTIKSERHKI
jgi:7-cyano-7-deazaguanine synthase